MHYRPPGGWAPRRRRRGGAHDARSSARSDVHRGIPESRTRDRALVGRDGYIARTVRAAKLQISRLENQRRAVYTALRGHPPGESAWLLPGLAGKPNHFSSTYHRVFPQENSTDLSVKRA